MNAMFVRSPIAVSLGSGSMVLRTGSLSPVSDASSMRRSSASIRRRSAGTPSPGFQRHDVARHQLDGVDLVTAVLTLHIGQRRCERVEGFHRPQRPQFGHETDHGVGHQHEQHGTPSTVLPIANPATAASTNNSTTALRS
jgi:hypothetical protein